MIYSAGADVYHPSLAYLLSASGGMLAVWVGGYIEKSLRVDDAVGAVAVHGFCGFYGVFLVGIFAGGFPTGVNNVPSSFGGQLMGMLAFFPLAFLPGYIVSWLLKKANLLRVPPEVELEGLDMAEFQQDFFPEFERVPEVIVLPDGQEVEAAPILIEEYASEQTDIERAPRGKELAVIDSSPTTAGRTSPRRSGRSARRTPPARTSSPPSGSSSWWPRSSTGSGSRT